MLGRVESAQCFRSQENVDVNTKDGLKTVFFLGIRLNFPQSYLYFMYKKAQFPSKLQNFPHDTTISPEFHYQIALFSCNDKTHGQNAGPHRTFSKWDKSKSVFP